LYSEKDLKSLDVKKHVIKRQDMYFGTKGASAEKICSGIAEGALILGCTHTEIVKLNDWWIIAGDKDWLKLDNQSKINENNAFNGLCPFPEYGINAIRTEYFSNVFSSSLATWDGEKAAAIKGNINDFLSVIADYRKYKRILGFKFEHVT
jgi:hypothetical protein